MIVYLASPASQIQADVLKEMPALLSFGCWAKWLDKYQQIFSRILIDSGAFSELRIEYVSKTLIEIPVKSGFLKILEIPLPFQLCSFKPSV